MIITQRKKLLILTFTLLAGISLISCSSSPSSGGATTESPGGGGGGGGTGLGYKRVFVSSVGYSSAAGTSGTFDSACGTLAAAAGLTGNWISWTSSTTGGSALSRLNATGPWYLVDGTTLIANNVSDLTDGTIQNPIYMTETGAGLAPAQVMTGTNSDGSLNAAHSTNWTNSTTSCRVGTTSSTGSTWTSSSTIGSCGSRFIYCFEIN